MDITEHIGKVLRVAPEAWAIEFQGRQLSWGAIGALAAELETLFDSQGIAPGTQIGLLGRNWVETVAAFVAVLASGRKLVLLNPLRPPAQIAAEIETLELRAIIAAHADWLPEIVAATQGTGSARIALTLAGGQVALKLDDPGAPQRFTEAPEQDGTLIRIQTSGTTGAPKRINIAEKTIAASLADGVRSAKGSREADLRLKNSPTFVFGPLVHTSGTFNVLMSVFEVRPIVLFDKFDVNALRAALVQHRPKFLPLPPTALRMLLDSPATQEELSSLLAVRCGTAALPVPTQIAFEEKFGVPVLTNYGATEFMGTVTGWALADYKARRDEKRGSVGKSSPGVTLRIIDPDTGGELPADNQGVLEAKVVRLDGGKNWVRTSDLAWIDAEGYVYILGRTDDAIIRGGFKIMAGKVSDAINKHPAVKDSIVLPIADERLGQIPVAAVELKPGAELADKALADFCRTLLLPYEVPARFKFVPALPRTVSDKISRPETLKLLAS